MSWTFLSCRRLRGWGWSCAVQRRWRPCGLRGFRTWFDGISLAGKALTDLQKYKLIGNSWPVPVTAAILAGIFRHAQSGHLAQAA